jgi:hypothetical protein
MSLLTKATSFDGTKLLGIELFKLLTNIFRKSGNIKGW